MAYYQAGDYYRAGAPANYAAGGFLGGLVRGIGRVARTVLPAVVPGVGGVVAGLIPGGSSGAGATSLAKMGPGPRPEPGVTGFVHRLVPGGSTGFMRSRRMNVANSKALRRSIRRLAGFERLAQRVGHFTRPGTRYHLKIRKARKRKA